MIRFSNSCGGTRVSPGNRRLCRTLGVAIATGGAIISTVVGCSGDVDREIPGDSVRITRLLDVAEVEEFKREDALNDVTVFSWSFADQAEIARWTVFRDTTHLTTSPPCLRLDASDKIRVLRTVALDSKTVDVIEIRTSGMTRGRADLFWAGSNEAFTPEKKIRVRVDSKKAEEQGRIQFRVADNPNWKGKVGRIRVDLQPIPNAEVDLCEVTGIKNTIRDDLVAGGGIRTFAVDLGNTVKNGFVVPTDTELRLLVTPPSEALQLKFSYAIQMSPQDTSVRFRVTAVRPGDDESVTLFDSTAADGGWHEANIDLDGLSPGELTLVFRTDRVDPPADRAALAAWADLRIVSPATEPPPPNVILISLDTLRADALSLYGNPNPTSPVLDSWAPENAVVFENAVAASPWTLPSHISMLTGLHSLNHGVNHRDTADDSFIMLAERLRDRGYTTRAVTGGGFLHPMYGFSQGFDVYAYWEGRHDSAEEIDVTFGTAADWLRELQRQPFFLFVHTYEPHAPYLPRQPYFEDNASEQWRGFRGRMLTTPETRDESAGFQARKQFVVEYEGEEKRLATEEEFELARLLYESGVAYTDSKIGLILKAVHDLGLASNTLIVITSDHGEALGEKGLAAHAYLYDFNIMIPLVIGFPDRAYAGRRVETQVATVDIVPTILDALKMDYQPGLDGHSVLGLLDGTDVDDWREIAFTNAASSNYGVAVRQSNTSKVIFNDTAWDTLRGATESYDLAADPDEETNLGNASGFTAGAEDMINGAFLESAGVHVVIENTLSDHLAGFLTAPRISPTWVKSMCAPEVELEWEKPGTVRFSIPPGTSCHLLFDRLESNALDVRIEKPATIGRLSTSVNLDQRTEPWRTVWEDGRWLEGPLGQSGRNTGITLWVRGPAFGNAEDATGVDEEHLEQLRALGYVE